MKVTGDWLHDPNAQAVLTMLTDGGYHALAVGGCVRNALLGVPVTDIDIATDALPEAVIELARAAGLKPVPTGIDHGTVTVVAGGEGFEVTSFRHDEESFGRHARVSFGADLKQDAARRDFTMNALYATADGTLVDPLGGVRDLHERLVRFVGDPEARIREDYLRILRFFRFHAQYGDPDKGLNPDALAACAAHGDHLAHLSRERITAEMRKLLAARDPAPSVAAMAQAGVLTHVLTGANARALPILVHLEGDTPGGWLRRLAVLGGQDHGDHLRLSRAEARDLERLQRGIESPDNAAILGYRLGVALGADVVLARAALLESPAPADWRDDLHRGADAKFPVKPADLMPHFQGPDLGLALKRAESHWLAQDFAPDRRELLSLLGVA